MERISIMYNRRDDMWWLGSSSSPYFYHEILGEIHETHLDVERYQIRGRGKVVPDVQCDVCNVKLHVRLRHWGQFVSGCRNKLKFKTKEEGFKKVANFTKYNIKSIYECFFCDGYHGSSENRYDVIALSRWTINEITNNFK